MGLRADRLQSQSLLPGQSSLMFQRLRKSNLSSLAFKVKSRSVLHPCFIVHSIHKSASRLSVAVQAQQMRQGIISKGIILYSMHGVLDPLRLRPQMD